ncbi:hypothetical protein G1K57_06905 [Tenacibaculum finnmarkense]|uniref:hypothetical protein n=1 Tax=Tenacibaculum finnmarkense TaxID=2781243 RepID=UPI001E47D4EC|nr:hypothetical protein [Tenacibaculum finnmarkense]MCD8443929.1 hypothetical protein [Tenacibaculum finnmarkense genomovar ulcerans]MCG8807902.1 hypothetical protein [Tenacibaculum finnmarkense]MCG8818121.1 hypothetical protein [Tenacibaculum finnmarkense]MCG8859015.1 hypothetical protein [Tenacibaculum finnmarkense]
MKQVFLLFIIFSYSTLLTAQEVTVGGGHCGTSTNSSVPVKYRGYGKNNSWSVMLYKKNELNKIKGNLTELGFYVSCGNQTYKTVHKQRIYIKETNQNTITNSKIPDLTTFTKVYDGDITWRKKNYKPQIITLNTPFKYSGNKNLLVYFENESGQDISMFGLPFLWDYQGENLVAHTLYKLSDKSNSKGYIDKIRPITYFKFSPITSTPPEITMEADKSICSKSPFSFTGVSVTPAMVTLKWTTSGTGRFNNKFIKNPTYTPSATDSGNIILTLTAKNTDGSISKNFTLTINPLPTASIKKI